MKTLVSLFLISILFNSCKIINKTDKKEIRLIQIAFNENEHLSCPMFYLEYRDELYPFNVLTNNGYYKLDKNLNEHEVKKVYETINKLKKELDNENSYEILKTDKVFISDINICYKYYKLNSEIIVIDKFEKVNMNLEFINNCEFINNKQNLYLIDVDNLQIINKKPMNLEKIFINQNVDKSKLYVFLAQHCGVN